MIPCGDFQQFSCLFFRSLEIVFYFFFPAKLFSYVLKIFFDCIWLVGYKNYTFSLIKSLVVCFLNCVLVLCELKNFYFIATLFLFRK